MRVLLINPPIKNLIGLEMPLFVRQNEGVFPPLGLLYIASYLKRYVDCEVKILDTLAQEMDYQAIEKYIQEFHPNVVGITAHTHNLIDVILVADIVKKIDKKIHICLGGPHINVFPREAINIPAVDSVILGDGEEAFAELVSCIAKGSDHSRIKGLIFKQDNKYINTGVSQHIEDLNSLPFPDRRLLDYKRYYSILGKKAMMTTMVSSRGCPYQCTFCSTPKDSYRMRSPENIVDEIEQCLGLGIEEIHFVDDVFNVEPERTIKMCDEIRARRLKISWSFRGRIDKITKDLLTKSKQAGCHRVHLGVETSTDEGLKRLKKGITIEQTRQVFRWTRELGINTVAYFLIGCPDEKTRQDIFKTINFSKEINPNFVLYNILTPYPQTELYGEGFRQGILKSDFWQEFALNPQKDFQPKFWPEWFSEKELVSFLNYAYRSFYLRPKFLLRMLASSGNFSRFSRRLKTGLEILKIH